MYPQSLPKRVSFGFNSNFFFIFVFFFWISFFCQFLSFFLNFVISGNFCHFGNFRYFWQIFFLSSFVIVSNFVIFSNFVILSNFVTLANFVNLSIFVIYDFLVIFCRFMYSQSLPKRVSFGFNSTRKRARLLLFQNYLGGGAIWCNTNILLFGHFIKRRAALLPKFQLGRKTAQVKKSKAVLFSRKLSHGALPSGTLRLSAAFINKNCNKSKHY